MAHTGLFATSAECIAKMGDNYNSTNVNEARINEFCLQAEAYINVKTGYNWSDEFTAPATTTLNADVWYLLSEAESCFVGIYGLNYKPKGEDGAMSIIEYEDRVAVLAWRLKEVINLLRETGTQKFMGEA